MDEREPVDDTLSELLAEPAHTLADEDRALELVVGQARQRSRRRRTIRAFAALVVVVLVACVGVAIIADGRRESQVQVQVPPTGRLSAADVTFAIFHRPPTSADQIPQVLDHFQIDPKIGSRLAISADGARLFVYGTTAPAQGEMYCTAIMRPSGGGAGCTTTAAIAQFGASVGTDDNGDGRVIAYGLVPDFVTRVTYNGQNVPIVENAFLVDDVPGRGRFVFSTPDGDKTIDLGTGPITPGFATVSSTTAPEPCTNAAFSAPAPSMPKWQRVTHTISVGYTGNPETVDPSFPNASPRIGASAAWAASMSHRNPGSYEMFLGQVSALYPFDVGNHRSEVQNVLAWVIVGHHVPVVPDGGANLVEPGSSSATTAPARPLCSFGDSIEAIDATTGHDIGNFSERG